MTDLKTDLAACVEALDIALGSQPGSRITLHRTRAKQLHATIAELQARCERAEAEVRAVWDAAIDASRKGEGNG